MSIDRRPSRPLKVCMLSANFWPIYPRRGTRHPLVLAEMLVKAGYKVRVVTAFPQDVSGKVSPKYRGKLIVRECLEEMEIIRVPVLPIDRLGVTRKLIFYFSFMFSSFLALLFVRNADIVLVVEPDVPFSILPGFLFSRVTRSKYVVLVTDLWPDVVFDYGFAKSRLAKKAIASVTVFAYKLADHIMTITKELKTGIMKYGIPKDKISVIEQAADTSLFRPILRIRKRAELGLSDMESKFIVLYSGSFSLTFDFDTLLEAAKILEPYKDVAITLLGDGESKNQILRKSRELELKNVFMLGPVSKAETVASFINCVDVCVVPMKSKMSVIYNHPSKIFEFWACGKPIIGCCKGALANLINESGAGIAVEPENPEALAKGIVSLYRNREVAIRMGTRGLALVLNRFSYEVVGTNLSKMIEQIAQV